VVTVSIGGATVVPRADDSPQTLVDGADHALYEAKAAGRDKVVWRDALL
jgi:PleD family two-component response regulator